MPQARWEAYGLTTFAQPVSGIVDACIAWLSRLTEGDTAETVHLSAQMIWRQSVRAPTPISDPA